MPLAARFVLILTLLALAAGAGAGSARAASYADRRVSAIPASALLSEDPESLVDPRRQAAAHQLDLDRRALFFFWAFSQIVALVGMWRSGAAARIRDVLRRRVPSPILVRFLFGFAVATVAALASLPAGILRYHTALIYDLDREPALVWIARALQSWVLDALAFGFLTAFVYTLVARTRLWYVYAIVGLFACALALEFIAPVAILPLYDRVHPPPAGGRLSDVVALEREAGVSGVPFVVAEQSARSPAATATIDGFGPTKRVVLSDALIVGATAGELRFVVARELGHYTRADRFKIVLMQTVAFVLAIVVGATVADRLGFRRDDDPLARLPLVAAMLGVAALAIFPAYNAYARELERGADRYGLALTRDPASAERYFIRLADEDLTPLCPSPLERTYFLASPPLGERIALAQGRADPCR